MIQVFSGRNRAAGDGDDVATIQGTGSAASLPLSKILITT
jgi:hypothetical protein